MRLAILPDLHPKLSFPPPGFCPLKDGDLSGSFPEAALSLFQMLVWAAWGSAHHCTPKPLSSSWPVLLCPKLHIRETTKEPTQMQTHEGLFTSSSLGPSIPDTVEQGLGPPRWVTAGFLWASLGDFQKGWRNFSSSVYILIWGFQEH